MRTTKNYEKYHQIGQVLRNRGADTVSGHAVSYLLFDMKATNRVGHEWQGEKYKDGHFYWWLYKDEKGNLYESKEVPTYYIVMDNAQMTEKGIVPIS